MWSKQPTCFCSVVTTVADKLKTLWLWEVAVQSSQEHFWIHNPLDVSSQWFLNSGTKLYRQFTRLYSHSAKSSLAWDYMRPLYWLVHFGCMHVKKSHGNLPAKNYRYPPFLTFVLNNHGEKLSLVHIVCGCSVQKSNIILLCISTPLPHSKCCSAELPLRVGLICAT